MSDMLTQPANPATPVAAGAAAAVAPSPQDEPEFRIRPITVAEYNRMAEVGILDPDERVELVDGLLIVPPPMGDAHWDAVARMQHRIAMALGERALVTSQLPVIVSDVSEPNPDIVLIRPRDDFYGHGVPYAPDVFAVVEASDSSLRFDHCEKLAMYARGGIPEYWIVNVRAKEIEIHRGPWGDKYAEARIAKPGDTVAFGAFLHIFFDANELLA